MRRFSVTGKKPRKLKNVNAPIEYESELYHWWPNLAVEGCPISPLGPQPRHGAQALAGAPPFAAWRAAIPPSVITTIERYGTGAYTWPFLHLAGALGAQVFVDRCRECPAYPSILWQHLRCGLITNAAFALAPADLVLATVPLPYTVVRRIAVHSADWPNLELLASAWPRLGLRTQRTLRHVPRITTDMILCVTRLPKSIATPGLIYATQESQFREIFESVCEVKARTRGEWRWGHVKSYDTLVRLPLRIKESHAWFGTPPFPPIYGLEALETDEAVEAEAVELGHCLASLQEAITQRSLFAYRLTHPERATVVLSYVAEADNWTLETIAGPQNRSLTRPVETQAYVRAWIEQNGGLP